MAHKAFSVQDSSHRDKGIEFMEAGKYLCITIWDFDEEKDTDIALDAEACDFILKNLPELVDKIRTYTKKLESE